MEMYLLTISNCKVFCMYYVLTCSVTDKNEIVVLHQNISCFEVLVIFNINLKIYVFHLK